jgi:hypothetical protein
MATYSSEATYFQSEGKDNLDACLRIAMAAALSHGLGKLVIFTARGDGIQLALELQRYQSEYEGIRLVGVTFPQGKLFARQEGQQPPTRIEPERLEAFRNAGVQLIRARLPFDPIWSNYPTSSTLGKDLSFIGNALNMFGGGMSLCVQAVLMACDAGALDWGEHVVVMTADTSLLVRAAPTDHFLTDLIVREILCKPIFLNVSRNEDVPITTSPLVDITEDDDISLLGFPDPDEE